MSKWDRFKKNLRHWWRHGDPKQHLDLMKRIRYENERERRLDKVRSSSDFGNYMERVSEADKKCGCRDWHHRSH